MAPGAPNTMSSIARYDVRATQNSSLRSEPAPKRQENPTRTFLIAKVAARMAANSGRARKLLSRTEHLTLLKENTYEGVL